MNNLTHLYPGEEDGPFTPFSASTPLPIPDTSTPLFETTSTHHYLFHPEAWTGGGGPYNDSYNSTGYLLAGTISTEPTDILEMKEALEHIRFVVQRILVPILAGVGIFGNTITCIVLTRRDMRSSTNCYLTALAASDIVYLVMFFCLSLSHIPGMNAGHTVAYWHFFKYALWFNDAASATSTWLTVTFTIERWVAVCHPIKGKVYCTPSRARKAIMTVYALCYSLTATTPHEWVVVTAPSAEGFVVTLEASALGDNNAYITVFFWFSAVTFTLLPLLLLSVFNTLLIIEVKRSGHLRRSLSERPYSRKAQVGKDRKTTLVLIAVVVLALVCQTPAAVALLYSVFHQPPPTTTHYYYIRIINNLFNLMSASNAALNFVLYCALSNKFRDACMVTFCKKKGASPLHSRYNSSVRYSRRSSNQSGASKPSPHHQIDRHADRRNSNQPPYLSVPKDGNNHFNHCHIGDAPEKRARSCSVSFQGDDIGVNHMSLNVSNSIPIGFEVVSNMLNEAPETNSGSTAPLMDPYSTPPTLHAAVENSISDLSTATQATDPLIKQQ